MEAVKNRSVSSKMNCADARNLEAMLCNCGSTTFSTAPPFIYKIAVKTTVEPRSICHIERESVRRPAFIMSFPYWMQLWIPCISKQKSIAANIDAEEI
ncbi:hypothetical protein Pelo_4047 [Pelomyxa schiedti]|nr:hypothetical protein Pelo_4047 [Pelomyxa schiedti]